MDKLWSGSSNLTRTTELIMKRYPTLFILFSVIFINAQVLPPPKQELNPIQKPQPVGYRGIWYSSNPIGNQYEYKLSGGLGTHPTAMVPMAWPADLIGPPALL